MTAAETCFWACTALAAYAYVGYPVLLWGFSRFLGRSLAAPAEGDDDGLPSLSLVVAAYNEEAVIEERLRNALAMDYPADRLEILVGSDGSTDRTAEIVLGYAGRGVRLHAFAENRGKAGVLNSLAAEAGGDVLLMSDANTEIDHAAARRLVRWFRDPRVGVVVGRLVLTDHGAGRNADGLYWKYETFLKLCEARLGALLGANGAIYAIRRDLYTPLPPGTIIDDFVIPLLARIRTGCAIVYDPDAVAVEETASGVRAEFNRRARIGAGGYQSLPMLWPLLDPRQGWAAFAFLSHKILRWLCPFMLIGMLVSNLFLWNRPLYMELLAVQTGFYLFAAVTAFVPSCGRLLKPLRMAPLFVSMNAALLVGSWRWMTGRQGGAWRRTERRADPETTV